MVKKTLTSLITSSFGKKGKGMRGLERIKGDCWFHYVAIHRKRRKTSLYEETKTVQRCCGSMIPPHIPPMWGQWVYLALCCLIENSADTLLAKT